MQTSADHRGPRFVTGSILRHVLVMTGTGATGLVAIFLAELVDLLFLGMLGDIEVIAAVGYASPLMFVTTAIAIGLSIATVSLVSPALGQGDRARARRLSASAHVFTFFTALVLGFALLPLMPWLLSLLGAKGRPAALAFEYLAILVPALPPLALAMTSSAVLRSAGDAKRAMHVTLGAAVVSVILDPIFIFGLGLGLHGAALATAIARVVIMVIGLHAVIRVHGLIERPTIANCRQDLAPILAIALPAVATNIANPLANGIVTAAFAPFGDAAVAGWAVIIKVQPVMFAFVFAMSGSVGPIIGQNLGARQFDRMRAAFTTALAVAAGYTLVAWLLLALLAPLVIAAFAVKGQGAELVWLYCTWLAPLFGFQGALFVANAVFNTLGRPKLATAINWSRALLGTLPFVAIGSAWLGAPGVLVGNLVGGVLFGTLAVWICARLIDGIGNTEPPAVRRGWQQWLGSPHGFVAAARSSITAMGGGSRAPHTGPDGTAAMPSGLRSGVIGGRDTRADWHRMRIWLVDLPRPWKRLILAANDFVLLTAAVWLAMSLRYGQPFSPPGAAGYLLLLAAPAIGVAAFSGFGLYRMVTRYITVRGSAQVLYCIGLSVMFWAMLALIFGAAWIRAR